ncbi:MAG: phosphatidylserine decarboxylase [Gammaproteobacteria bacterium]|nr:phosphatidylserine decarboxylase [Gammaproteobacteria bacterium]NNC96940.1 phosphatidylserine decarboxylase [Gammaproteobacteria bacterium]NNM13355.1 phosphatidylserine decarboxylase [Gammaproteobacteria bacterium]
MRNKFFIFLQHIIPQHFLSRTMHKIARVRTAWFKNFLIRNFVKIYNIDMLDYGHKDELDFESFNDFFTRALMDGARPIHSAQQTLCSPVDGAMSQSDRIENGQIIQAKGMHYSARRLLGDSVWAETYANGNFSTIYLAPFNYHRIHMPIDGKLVKMRYIPGKLFSVNLTTADNVDALFARNERVVCEFETALGKLIMVLVGAVFVGSIETVWAGEITPAKPRTAFDEEYVDKNISLRRGEEMGRFNMGSTVILLSDNPDLIFDKDLDVVRLGECIAELSSSSANEEE